MDFYSQAYELLSKMSSAYEQTTGHSLGELTDQEKRMICAYAFGLTNKARWDDSVPFEEWVSRNDDGIMSELISQFFEIPSEEAKNIQYVGVNIMIEDSGISEQAFQLGLIARKDCLDGKREVIANDIKRLLRYYHANAPKAGLESGDSIKSLNG